MQKGDYVRVLRTDETDDNFFGEVFGKSGYFPNYYAGAARAWDGRRALSLLALPLTCMSAQRW